MTLSSDQEKFSLKLIKEYLADNGYINSETKLENNRKNAIHKIRANLNKLINDSITLEEFKRVNDSLNKSNRSWGFSGFSGQMFFNVLYNSSSYQSKSEELTSALKRSLRQPSGIEDAKKTIREFEEFVKLIKDGSVGIKKYNPNIKSILYFLSYFWQILAPDKFPIFYPDTIVSAMYSQKMLSKQVLSPENLDLSYEEFYRLDNELLALYRKHYPNIQVNYWLIEHVFSRFIELNKEENIQEPFKKLWRGEEAQSSDQTEQATARLWQDLTADEQGQIVQHVLSNGERRLEIDESIVLRILHHLMIGKNVVLIGPPGTGKTDLAQRLLKECSDLIVPKKDRKTPKDPITAVASYEWGRYEVIGGNSLQDSFHLGCVTKAIKEQRLLLIDEFNRADMNKAFGEMFMAIEHGKIELREDEKPDWVSEEEKSYGCINIPNWFRMICTMNDYDKNLLNELSYGLLRRFAFVDISPPAKDKETRVVLERVKESLKTKRTAITEMDSLISEVQDIINAYFDFIDEVRKKRMIGVSTSIDVIKYVLFERQIQKKDSFQHNSWKDLDHALLDYVLPQLDRLDTDSIRCASESATKSFNLSDGSKRTPMFVERIAGMLSKLQELDKLFAPEPTRE